MGARQLTQETQGTGQNQTSQTTAYTWDNQDRLIEIKRGGSETDAQIQVSYQYDSDGHRVKEIQKTQQGDQVTTYLIDSTFPNAQVVEAKTTQNNQTRTTHYVWGNSLIKHIRGGQGTYYHEDVLGSIQTISDPQGNPSDHYRYDAFGNLQSHQGPSDQPYRFAGEHYDTSAQLQYHRARWYDPGIGRFTVLDFFTGLPDIPASLHKYAYATNDPVNQIDPTGLSNLLEQMTAVNINNSLNFARWSNAVRQRFNVLKQMCDRFIDVIPTNTHRHHSVPWFLRGIPGKKTKIDDELMFIVEDVHNKFHSLLDAVLKMRGITSKNQGTQKYIDFRAAGGDMSKVFDALMEAAQLFDEACDAVDGKKMSVEVGKFKGLLGL